MSKKYDRHIELFNYLRQKGRCTFVTLSYEFDVSLKTIKKDVYELAYFFPIDTYRGRYGGVELNKAYAINNYFMTRSDLDILRLGLARLIQEDDSPKIKRLLEKISPKENLH